MGTGKYDNQSVRITNSRRENPIAKLMAKPVSFIKNLHKKPPTESINQSSEILEKLNSTVKIRHTVDPDTALREAIIIGDIKEIEIALSRGANLKQTDNEGSSLLHLAAQAGHLEILDFLVSHGIDINTLDQQKQNALHIASLLPEDNHNKPQVIQFLITLGINIDQQDSEGNTALHYLAMNHDIASVKFLVTTGAKTLRNLKGESPIDVSTGGIYDQSPIASILTSEPSTTTRDNTPRVRQP